MKKQVFFLSLMLASLMSFSTAVLSFTPPSGSVTQEGIIISAVASPGETIQEFQLFDSSNKQVDKETGCQSQSCTYDVSGFPSGGYTVVVITNSGSFSGPIQL